MDLAMIHATFRDWTADLVERGFAARFAHGFEPVAQGLVVTAMLLTARPDPQRRAYGATRQSPPERPLARLRYLVAVSGPNDEAQTEQALLALLAAVDRQPAMDLLSAELPPSWWLAYGIAPRPAFQLEACLTERVVRPVLTAVRTHRLDLAGFVTVHGRVVGIDDAPIAGAEIELLATGRVVRSDHRGAFRLRMPNGGPGADPGWVRVQARGVEQRFPIPATITERRPWLLRLPPPGD
ncbi:MAG: carboxypeptidase regulatory-like domain-containing protein [Nitrococcus mobilis]|nr:carboxypeptidase regulatory-like domain-containing protein [Nitrococcus mobilis]